MRLPPNRWSGTPGAKGVLFFAQQMREMMASGTFESFRAFSLDTVSRLKETRAVLIDVEAKRIPVISAEPFREELRWSLAVDPIIRVIDPDLSGLLERQLKDNKSRRSSMSAPFPEFWDL
jgi:hypothetical protein